MPVYITLLRGINVSGQKLLKMEDLKTSMSTLGYTSIETYIQSGNIIFHASTKDTQKLEKEIFEKIKKVFGFTVPVLVLGSEEFKKISLANPFLQSNTFDPAFVHISFLSKVPNHADTEVLAGLNFAPDKFQLIRKEVYLYCPNGYGKTKLNNSFLEKKLQVTATTRNWKTVQTLLEIAAKIKS